MENGQRKYSNTVPKTQKEIIKSIKSARKALERISNDNYLDKEFSRHYKKYPMVWETIDDSAKVGWSRLVPSTKEASKDFNSLCKKEEELKQKDWEVFLKEFRNSNRWWD